jgi:hypothetical protein
VRDIGTDADVGGRVVLETSVQIAQGNSGGPSLNDAGEQIGINTYSEIQCQDLNCYGDGLVRDIADLKVLIDRNNIVLQTGGVSDVWSDGLDAYVAGNYTQALDLFTRVKQQYAANYLAPSMLRLASQYSGTTSDTSTTYQAKDTIALTLVFVGIVAAMIVTVSGFLLAYLNYKHARMLRKHQKL